MESYESKHVKDSWSSTEEYSESYIDTFNPNFDFLFRERQS